MSVSSFDSHDARSIKDLSDAIRRLNNAKKFSTLHKVNQLETIKEYSTYGVGTSQTFLKDRNTPDDYIPLYEAYPDTLAPLREAIDGIQLPQELFFPLIRTTSTVRRKLLWDMENGAAYSDLKLEHKIQEHFENRKSDNDLMFDRGEREALDAVRLKYAHDKADLLEKSKKLYRLMCDHLAFWACMPRDWMKYERLAARAPKRIAAQEVKREEIIVLAAATLALFERYYGRSEFAEMRDWMHIGIDDPTAMYLASCHYALRQVANGNFRYYFPSVASRYSYWSALGSIARLAGVQSRKLSRVPRYNRKLVMKLDAVSLWAGGGGQALGLETAGFKVRKLYENNVLSVETLRSNRHEWDVETGMDWTSLPKKLDILTAGMTLKHWSNKGEGADAEGSQLRKFKEAVLVARPRSFFFETHIAFLDGHHVDTRLAMIQEFDDAGYRVICRGMDASKLGLPYERKRAIVVGIEKDSYSRLGVFALPKPVQTPVGKAIARVAFPHHSSFKTPRERETLLSRAGRSKQLKLSKRQRVYDSWAETWVRKHDLKAQKEQSASTWKPLFDLGWTFGLTYSDIILRWSEAGFIPEIENEVPTLTKGPKNEKIHLSIPILKRLQGLPDDWHIAGSSEKQAEQLMDFSPPLVTFIVARKIHEALTNRPYDLSNPSSYEVVSGRRQRPVVIAAPQPYVRRLVPPMPAPPSKRTVEGYPRNGGPEIDDNPRAVSAKGTIKLIGPFESSHPQAKLADEWRKHVDEETKSKEYHFRNGEDAPTFMT